MRDGLLAGCGGFLKQQGLMVPGDDAGYL